MWTSRQSRWWTDWTATLWGRYNGKAGSKASDAGAVACRPAKCTWDNRQRQQRVCKWPVSAG